jgi:hypothetical protein
MPKDAQLRESLSSIALLEFLTPHPQNPSTLARAWMSGFLSKAANRRVIIAAAHFDPSSRNFEARFPDLAMKLPLTLALRQFDDTRRMDVAVFSFDEPGSAHLCRPLEVAADSTFSVGDEVYIAGYPLPDLLQKHYGLPQPMLVVKKGVVSAKIAANNGRASLIILDVIWDVGMSGGPVIHAASGKVVGIVSSRPQIDNQPIEIVASPSGDQILAALGSI